MEPPPRLHPATSQGRPGHKRAKSSVLKSIMNPKSNHKRTPSEGASAVSESAPLPLSSRPGQQGGMGFMLPPDHPHNRPNNDRVLGEIGQNSSAANQRKSQDVGRTRTGRASPEERGRTREAKPTLHARTKSAISLRSLGKDKDKSAKEERETASKDGKEAKLAKKENQRPDRSQRGRRLEKEEDRTPKKSKSSTGLSSLFSKSRSPSKRPPNQTDTVSPTKEFKDKENTTPPSSAVAAAHTPIWAQFASVSPQSEDPGFTMSTTTTTVPLNDLLMNERRLALDAEIKRYTPQNYSPSKQRNFHDYIAAPTLQQRAPATRPKSMYLPSASAASALFEGIGRRVSGESRRSSGERPRTPAEEQKDAKGGSKGWTGIFSTKKDAEKQAATGPSKGSRVMAAVAVFNGKAKEAEADALDVKQIEAAFEAVLESRNVPEATRQKMRTMNTRLKADFVKQNTAISQPSSKSSKHESAGFELWSDSKEGNLKAVVTDEAVFDDDAEEESKEDDNKKSKRSRPRSRTFTFHKSEKRDKSQSRSKKHKASTSVSGNIMGNASTTTLNLISGNPKSRPKSVELPRSGSSVSLTSLSGNRSSKSGFPQEFVDYLRQQTNPPKVEVGRLHKLRLLLRNETVSWTSSFIQIGGMDELVSLLYRIMEIEWREEHEDQLLHEALLCMKGLCTTDLALHELDKIADNLFPKLLSMLFDPEHKGPSEFTTRSVIINLLFSHLSSATPNQKPTRAAAILKYLEDPAPPEEKRPMDFILSMRQPRPYRVWNKEIVNVTKEVFWIFLHQLNVIPLPAAAKPTSRDNKDTIKSDSRPVSRSNAAETTTTTTTAFAPVDWEAESKKTYLEKHYPVQRPPVPAAPYIGGVEWDATNYLAAHLDLLNGLTASLPSRQQRNDLRALLKASGFEKCMGGSLRTCKEKFYGGVHDGLRTWVGAAWEDGWEVGGVRMGKSEDEGLGAGSPVKGAPASPVKSPKKKVAQAPVLEMPRLELGLDGGARGRDDWVL